jgi:hypothetical protein
MVIVSVGFGRRLDGHAMQIVGSLLATSRLSPVELPSMAGVGATQAIRQAFMAAWKSAISDCQVVAQIWRERQLCGKYESVGCGEGVICPD